MSFLSSSLQHLAFMGESGIQNQTKMPQQKAMMPWNMKSACHWWIGCRAASA